MMKHSQYLVFFLLALCCAFQGWSEEAQSEETVISPTFAGQWPYHPSKAIAVDPDRGLILLGDGDRLDILDTAFSPLAHLTLTRNGLVSGLCYDPENRLLYVACKNDGLKVVNVADPQRPAQVGAYAPESDTAEVNGVFVENGLALLAGGVEGLFLLDVADPSAPALLAVSRLPGGFGLSYAVDGLFTGTTAFVADLYTGIHIVDISNLEKPAYKKGVALPGSHDITLSGDDLFVTMEGNGMAVVNIADPFSPKVDSVFVGGGVETAVRVDGTLAYVGYGAGGLRVVDVSDTAKPVHNPAWAYAASGCVSIALDIGAHLLYSTSDNTGLEKIDITDKTAMTSLAAWDTPADAFALDVTGDHVVMVDDTAGLSPESEGLRIVRVSPFQESVQLYLTGFCPTPGQARDVMASGDIVLVADGEAGLQVVSLTDKTAPTIIGSLDTPGAARGVFVLGNTVYVADGEAGLEIVDIADKARPVRIGGVDTPGAASGVVALGGYAVVADTEAGLQVVDISDQTTPVIIGVLDTPGAALGVFVKEDIAYVADGEAGLLVISLADKSRPVRLAAVDTPGFARNVMVTGHYAYVADGWAGVSVIHIENPAQPHRDDTLTYDSAGAATDIFTGYASVNEAMFAFIADGPGGLVALNLIPEKTNDKKVDAGGSGGACFIGALGSFTF